MGVSVARDRCEIAIAHSSAELRYAEWPAPTCIVSDGPYGVGGYAGDPPRPDKLPAWYEPHVRAWADRSGAKTTLWFWCTEIGWALTHPVLDANGWVYRGFNVWNKGVGHIAGNINTGIMRKFPAVTEVCVQYIRDPVHSQEIDGSRITMQHWLREEWRRTGLPWREANTACQVADAASRKYLAADHMWYQPPPDKVRLMAAYANKHGDPEGRPYFAGDPDTDDGSWLTERAKFDCPFGVTNVWSTPSVAPANRVRNGTGKGLHPCEKPVELYKMIIEASTDEGDVVWEPFGGLCPGAVACASANRRYFAAETDAEYVRAAKLRLEQCMANGTQGVLV